MKITYIKFPKKKKDENIVLMKHLRNRSRIFDMSKKFRLMKQENNNNFMSQLNNEYVNRFLNNLHKIEKNASAKKKQLTLFVLSLMLVTAGYMNYTNSIRTKLAEGNESNLGEAMLVNSNVISENTNAYTSEIALQDKTESNEEDMNKKDDDSKTKENENNEADNKTIETSTSTIKEQNVAQSDSNDKQNKINDYFTETKLERDKMFSEMIESYQKIIDGNNSSQDQKNEALNQIKAINEKKESIATIENLFKTKNFENSAVIINDSSVNIIIKSDKDLTKEEVAQIQNIVTRELKCEIEDIHIMTHN